ncbi:MAG: helix-turn-helix transcriptional regulator, partial [Cyclobacteriaceae bacterium]|nr:helix-turn-helix transcriptional regulator [Cyclobacteriaceae bacterium]
IYRHVQGIKENKKVEKVRSPIKIETLYKNSGLKKADSERYLKELFNYMENEKPYLNNRLGLKDVAEYLNISVHHLSQVINEQLDKNFFDFVNDYRVTEVKSLLRDPKYKQFTLLAIAYDCGFNSKSSFNSVFKKITGLTPSSYVKLKIS